MSDVKQTIQVTNAGLSPILSIAQGTGMVDFEFTVSDFQIPAGSTAVAHNIQPTGNIVSQVCTLVGNVITVTPPAYYFLRGKNYMQIQVTGADRVNLFTFLIEVWCSPNISAPVVSQNPDLISQLMAMIGNTQDLDTTAKNNLVAAINEIYGRGVVDILDTEEEIEANTDTGKATGALVTKQLISDLGGCQITTEGSGEDTKFFIQLGADAGSKKELGNPMLVKIGAFTPPNFGASAHYDVDLGTSDYDTIVIIAIWSDQSDAVKAGIAISSSINNRSAYQSAYGSGATTTNECLHGENPYFRLIDGGATLRLLRGNIAWSNFPSYYLLLKLYPVINDMG